jgi:hypothetical protein
MSVKRGVGRRPVLLAGAIAAFLSGPRPTSSRSAASPRAPTRRPRAHGRQRHRPPRRPRTRPPAASWTPAAAASAEPGSSWRARAPRAWARRLRLPVDVRPLLECGCAAGATRSPTSSTAGRRAAARPDHHRRRQRRLPHRRSARRPVPVGPPRPATRPRSGTAWRRASASSWRWGRRRPCGARSSTSRARRAGALVTAVFSLLPASGDDGGADGAFRLGSLGLGPTSWWPSLRASCLGRRPGRATGARPRWS